MATTRCSSCKIVKFNAFFYRRSNPRYVLQPCKKCSKQISKERYRRAKLGGGEK